MLAALLLNRIGNTAGKRLKEERASRALENLRSEYFERQKAANDAPVPRPTPKLDLKPKPAQAAMLDEKLTVLSLPDKTANVGETRTPNNKKADEEIIAFLMILAEI